ncbi:MAG: DUF1385 domain-containing protein [Fimbriimonadales bacterium]|nr:DUF1385 domain-containing protein [Fimbriimonadales bacterium]
MPQGEYLQYGGQAIVEGVMMRSPRYYAVAVRAPNGRIVTQTEAIEATWVGRQRWLKWPFVRGTLALLDAMTLGAKAMRFAANVQLADEYQPADSPNRARGKPTPDSVRNLQVGGALIVGLAIGILLFVFLPNLLAEQLRRFDFSGTQINLTTEILKIVFFLAYVLLIGRMPEIRRIFRYHGAEHKAINALEHGQELSVETCKANSRFHPRCGTSFAIVVLLVSLLLFPLVPRYPLGDHHPMIVNVAIRFVLELLILPLVAGVSYEAIRLAGKFRFHGLVETLFQPGLWTQRLTTDEPDDDMVEVAVTALRAVIDAESSTKSVDVLTASA